MPTPAASLAKLDVPLDLAPMEARLVKTLPAEPHWQFEPKWDGFRCLAFRAGKEAEIRSKSGRSLSRFFPEVVANLLSLPAKRFVLDGEIVISLDGALSFDALQLRLHPAESRIRRLSQATPAALIAFDLLLDANGRSLLDQPLAERRPALETFFDPLTEPQGLTLSVVTRSRTDAQTWLDHPHTAIDGIICKSLDLPYRSGERAMLKVKNIRTADCVVGGFRYETGAKRVGSLLLGLYDEAGLLHHVGYTSAISAREKPALTKELEALIAPPGFTGDAPDAQSRWSTERTSEWQPLKPKLVVEVSYDHVTSERFRHGTRLLRWRPDKAPRQCTLEQIRAPFAAPA